MAMADEVRADGVTVGDPRLVTSMSDAQCRALTRIRSAVSELNNAVRIANGERLSVSFDFDAGGALCLTAMSFVGTLQGDTNAT